jgi:protein HIRA/HIR1
LFSFKDPKTGQVKETAVCALGSQDNGISVWWTGSARAVTGAQQIFTHSVLDLAWTKDGLGLFGCSYDGTVVFMEFDSTDFGTLLSENEQKKKLMKYGSRKTRRIIPESVAIVQLEEQLNARPTEEVLLDRMDDGIATKVGFSNQENQNPSAQAKSQNVMPRNDATPVKAKHMEVNVLERQTETVTKDGKKRIRPVLLSSYIILT